MNFKKINVQRRIFIGHVRRAMKSPGYSTAPDKIGLGRRAKQV